MKEKAPKRIHWLTVRLNPTEYEHLVRHFQQSTHRSISAYVRQLVLQKPVNIKYRNASIDDFLTDMVSLKKELTQLNNNSKTALEKLYTLERIGEFEQWILANETDKAALNKKIEAIQARINQLYSLWSQE